MAQKIISERWAYVQPIAAPSSPYVQAGQFTAPGLYRNSAILSARGQSMPPLVGSTLQAPANTFDKADSVLIRRVRLWSPAMAIGLCGAGVQQVGTILDLWASRHNESGFGTGRAIHIDDGLALGEWVDVNQTLTADEIPAFYGSDGWLLSCDMQTQFDLDGSRVSSAFVGVAFLNFQVQVDLAHTLPATYTANP